MNPEVTPAIESDSSKSGWGATFQGVRTGSRCRSDTTHQLLGIEDNLSGLAILPQGQFSIIMLVRSNAIAYLNKMGSPTRFYLCLLSLEIWEWCLDHHIVPHTGYLAEGTQLGNLPPRHQWLVGSFCHQGTKPSTACLVPSPSASLPAGQTHNCQYTAVVGQILRQG